MSRRPRRSWTKDQKQRIVSEVKERLKGGESLRKISFSLDINESSIRDWMHLFPSESFLPIKVESTSIRPEQKPAKEKLNRGEESISLVLPSGARFEPLHIGDVALLLEHLR